VPRYRARVAYDGTDYHGWQIQPNVPTVEGELTRALAQISQAESKVQGASRTDAGVHAEGQSIHFDYDGPMDAAELAKGLNGVSAWDVRVIECAQTEGDFHARHHACGKLYRYDLWADPVSNPLRRRYATHVPGPIDVEAMKRAAAHFVGEHDFTALQSASCEAPSPILMMNRVEIVGTAPALSVYVDGAAFLKYMVRTMVGTLLEVGHGRREADSIPDLLASRDRSQAGRTAKAHGLHLVEVRYDRPPP
jgi:tRNA pseudouridine38-40 synthase